VSRKGRAPRADDNHKIFVVNDLHNDLSPNDARGAQVSRAARERFLRPDWFAPPVASRLPFIAFSVHRDKVAAKFHVEQWNSAILIGRIP